LAPAKTAWGVYGGSVQLFSPNLYDSSYTTIGLGYGSFNSHRIFAEFNSGIKNNKAFYVRASQVYSDGYKYNSLNNSQSVFMSGELIADKSTFKINALVGHQQNQLAWLGVSEALIEQDRRTNADENERDNFYPGFVAAATFMAPKQPHQAYNQAFITPSCMAITILTRTAFLGLPLTNELYNYAFSIQPYWRRSAIILSQKNHLTGQPASTVIFITDDTSAAKKRWVSYTKTRAIKMRSAFYQSRLYY
jgi:iron complex outermembrane receptor protein